MELLIKSIPSKSGRYRFFQICIYFDILSSKTFNHSFWVEPSSLILLLEVNEFISQEQLEKVLFKSKIIMATKKAFKKMDKSLDVKKINRIIHFIGQLERMSTKGSPYWKISIETEYVITPRTLSSHFYNQILKMGCNIIKENIQILQQDDE